MKYADHRELVLDEFKQLVDAKIYQKTTLLDVGCRDLYFSKPLKELGWPWIGLDINGGDQLIKSSMENTPLPDSSIHVIFCSHAFEHTKDPLKALSEFYRILKGGGVLFMATPYPCEMQIFHMDKTHYFVLNELQLVRLLDISRFKLVSIHTNKNDSENPQDWNIITVAQPI